jgi:hypothetical protein
MENSVVKIVVAVVKYINMPYMLITRFENLLKGSVLIIVYSVYDDLPYGTAVLWLYCHKLLKAFYDLKCKIWK